MVVEVWGVEGNGYLKEGLEEEMLTEVWNFRGGESFVESAVESV
jgi:hypothetical protein